MLLQNLNDNCDDHRLHTLKKVFQEVIGTSDCSKNERPLGIQYQQVFSSPWARNIELEQRHDELIGKSKTLVQILILCFSIPSGITVLKEPEEGPDM